MVLGVAQVSSAGGARGEAAVGCGTFSFAWERISGGGHPAPRGGLSAYSLGLRGQIMGLAFMSRRMACPLSRC
eukprot:8295212-Pyramimonas_sp.AAC.1